MDARRVPNVAYLNSAVALAALGTFCRFRAAFLATLDFRPLCNLHGGATRPLPRRRCGSRGPSRPTGTALPVNRKEEPVPELTAHEKAHWRDRIRRRIDRKIAALVAAEPGFLERIRREAHRRALQSLGLADLQAELDAVARQREELLRRERQARRAMLATVLRVPLEATEEVPGGGRPTRKSCWPRTGAATKS